jgi:hypothetical protein
VYFDPQSVLICAGTTQLHAGVGRRLLLRLLLRLGDHVLNGRVPVGGLAGTRIPHDEGVIHT